MYLGTKNPEKNEESNLLPLESRNCRSFKFKDPPKY